METLKHLGVSLTDVSIGFSHLKNLPEYGSFLYHLSQILSSSITAKLMSFMDLPMINNLSIYKCNIRRPLFLKERCTLVLLWEQYIEETEGDISSHFYRDTKANISIWSNRWCHIWTLDDLMNTSFCTSGNSHYCGKIVLIL